MDLSPGRLPCSPGEKTGPGGRASGSGGSFFLFGEHVEEIELVILQDQALQLVKLLP